MVRGRFSAVPLIASLAGGLSRYYPSLGIALVDCVLEDIRWGLEHPGAGCVDRLSAARPVCVAMNGLLRCCLLL